MFAVLFFFFFVTRLEMICESVLERKPSFSDSSRVLMSHLNWPTVKLKAKNNNNKCKVCSSKRKQIKAEKEGVWWYGLWICQNSCQQNDNILRRSGEENQNINPWQQKGGHSKLWCGNKLSYLIVTEFFRQKEVIYEIFFLIALKESIMMRSKL